MVRRWGRRTAVLVGTAAVLATGIAVVYAAGGSYGGGTGQVVDEAPAWGGERKALDAAPHAPASTADSAATPAPGSGVPIGGVQRALVRTAQVAVEVGDPAAAGRQVRAAAAAAGGVVSEEQSGPTGAWMTLRVPTDALDRLVDQIAGLGVLTQRNTQVVDATEEVVDLDARVASQQAGVARVRALLSQAQGIGDVVAVESELSRRESDLDSLTGRLAALRNQVSLSTLTVDLRAAPAAEDDPATFAAGLGAGWGGLRAIGSALAAAVGFGLPFLPVLAVLAVLLWVLRRRLRPRSR